MTPEQIETMRRIQRGDFLTFGNQPTGLPEWVWDRDPLSGWTARLTEAGAEVLRLWEERDELKSLLLDLFVAAAPLVADAAVIGGPEVSAKTVAATVHDGLRRLHEDLQTERRRNVAIEEEGGAESILSDLGALLDARVGWFEGEGTVEHVRRALDERDSLRAAHAETLLVLAAEQGRQEGAPPGWERTSWLWQRCIGGPPITTLEVTRASTHPEDKPWHWRIFRPALIAEGYAATARAAMLAADSFSPPSGGRSERDSPPK